jgi:anti-sigma factor RsiW
MGRRKVNPAEQKLEKLQAALDGELDAAGMAEFERACAADPALAAEFAQLRALDAGLRRALPLEAAPEGLRARVTAMAAPPQRRSPIFDAPWRATSNAPWRAMAASLLVGVFAGYGALSMRPVASTEDRTLVSAFMRTQVGGQSVDVASSDRHTVKPWLAGRAPLAVAALDLSSSGFPLAGGRVEAMDGKIVPTLVYRRREHRIDVTELALSGGGEKTRLSRLDGYHLAHWSDSDRAYVAVTDLPEAELADFVALFRAAAASEREEVKKPGP